MEPENPQNALNELDDVEWVDCPECGLPAYVLERYVRPSTDGPLPHAVTVCARLHRLSTTEETADRIDPEPA